MVELRDLWLSEVQLSVAGVVSMLHLTQFDGGFSKLMLQRVVLALRLLKFKFERFDFNQIVVL